MQKFSRKIKLFDYRAPRKFIMKTYFGPVVSDMAVHHAAFFHIGAAKIFYKNLERLETLGIVSLDTFV